MLFPFQFLRQRHALGPGVEHDELHDPAADVPPRVRHIDDFGQEVATKRGT